MKKIEAIVRPDRFGEVKQALAGLGVAAITVSDVLGSMLGGSQRVLYRGQQYSADVLPKIKIEFVVSSREADQVIQAVIDAAWTGEIDDGQVFVSEITEAIRICNSQRDEAAV
jgi:nitrogen regulatory protein P-II 1